MKPQLKGVPTFAGEIGQHFGCCAKQEALHSEPALMKKKTERGLVIEN